MSVSTQPPTSRTDPVVLAVNLPEHAVSACRYAAAVGARAQVVEVDIFSVETESDELRPLAIVVGAGAARVHVARFEAIATRHQIDCIEVDDNDGSVLGIAEHLKPLLAESALRRRRIDAS